MKSCEKTGFVRPQQRATEAFVWFILHGPVAREEGLRGEVVRLVRRDGLLRGLLVLVLVDRGLGRKLEVRRGLRWPGPRRHVDSGRWCVGLGCLGRLAWVASRRRGLGLDLGLQPE